MKDNITAYRVQLVKDHKVSFGQAHLNNPEETAFWVKEVIEFCGQSDREQIMTIMLDAKNRIIGLNITATGTISSATVSTRDIMKCAILGNARAIVVAHNHISEDPSPSKEDIQVTKRIYLATKIMEIQLHDHIIVSSTSDNYYSMVTAGVIKLIREDLYNVVKSIT